jgi:hypothetical protein
MKIKLRIFISITLLFLGYSAFSQVPDSASIKQNKKGTTVNHDNNANVKHADQDDNSQNNKTTIKQVNGARPDMSKSRGARPPYIERQAGSGIPKGIGKPGGATGIRPGKR